MEKLKWQQKQLLGILGELGEEQRDRDLDTHLRHGKNGDFFFVEGVRSFQDGSLYDFEKRYPADFVYPLEEDGYLAIRKKGEDAFDLLLTPRGRELVRRRFRES